MNTKLTLLSLASLILMLHIGCGKREPVHDGLPLSVWVERLSSGLPEERGDAARVIAEIGIAAKSAEVPLRTAARQESIPDVKVSMILALKAIGAETNEFDDFMQKATAPIFDSSDDSFNLEPDEYYEGEQPESPNEDDLQYLQDIASGVTDSLAKQKFPQDAEAQRQWAEERRREQIGMVVNQLQNPDVLAEILRTGELEERRLAARMLVSRSGVNSAVVDALEGAKFDTDSLIRAAAIEALKKWSRPEE